MTMLKKYYQKYKEVFLYLIFGVLTTVVNILAFGVLFYLAHIDYLISNGIALAISILFAYLTNRAYVFHSQANDLLSVGKEFLSFVSFRLLSAILDMLIMYVGVSLLLQNEMYTKVLANVIVVILNYVFSKLFIFKK